MLRGIIKARNNNTMKQLFLNLVLTYIVAIISWCVIVVASGTQLDPESGAFFVSMDAIFFTVLSLISYYAIRYFDRIASSRVFLLSVCVISVVVTFFTKSFFSAPPIIAIGLYLLFKVYYHFLGKSKNS